MDKLFDESILIGSGYTARETLRYDKVWNSYMSACQGWFLSRFINAYNNVCI